MNHHKRHTGIAGIAENILQVHDVAFGDVEIIADADRRVDMDRKMEAAAFTNQVTENVILKDAVIIGSRHAPIDIMLVNLFRLLARRIAEFG